MPLPPLPCCPMCGSLPLSPGIDFGWKLEDKDHFSCSCDTKGNVVYVGDLIIYLEVKFRSGHWELIASSCPRRD